MFLRRERHFGRPTLLARTIVLAAAQGKLNLVYKKYPCVSAGTQPTYSVRPAQSNHSWAGERHLTLSWSEPDL